MSGQQDIFDLFAEAQPLSLGGLDDRLLDYIETDKILKLAHVQHPFGMAGPFAMPNGVSYEETVEIKAALDLELIGTVAFDTTFRTTLYQRAKPHIPGQVLYAIPMIRGYDYILVTC